MDIAEAGNRCDRIIEEVSGAVIVDRDVLQSIVAGFLSRGHVLLEDVPGTGKTLTARSIAAALGLSFSRVQFTPDLLPSDVLGTHVYDERDREFEFRPGPIFSNVVLADEINRASPKTQAALLEAMEERQVTVGGETHDLPDVFFVVATQNPIEHEGTFELPVAQKDRFIVKTSLGYPDEAGEREMINRRIERADRSPSVTSVCDSETAKQLRSAPERVRVADDVRDYIVSVSRATREDDRVEAGASPRGTERLLEVARATAAMEGRDYLKPDDVKRVAPDVLAHRLVLSPEARVEGLSKREVVADTLADVEVPTVRYTAR